MHTYLRDWRLVLRGVDWRVVCLAIAYGATGKFSEAVPMMENALATAAALQGFSLLPRMEAELRALRSGRPVRGDWRELAPRVEPPSMDAVAAFRDYPSEAP